MGNGTSLSQDTSTPPKLIQSFSTWFSSSARAYVSGFTVDSTNRLLLAGWNWFGTPCYKFYDIDTLEEVGSFDSKEDDDSAGLSCLFLSDTVCAVSSSDNLEIFSFKREDPPKENKVKSIKISDCILIKTLPLDQSAPKGFLLSVHHTILSLNSVSLNSNNNNSAQLVLASHLKGYLSFWKTPNKNQLDDGNQYHQVRFLDLKRTYNLSAKFCRAKFVSSSSCSSSENNANFVATYQFGFCLFNVSWSENEQNQEVNVFLLGTIQLSKKKELSNSVDGYDFSYIDVARHFVVVHAARGDVAYLYDLSNFRVVSELKVTTGNKNDHGNFPSIKISEDADVVVLGRSNNIHFFSQENNWKEVLFQQQEKPAINFGDPVYDLHLCCERLLVFSAGMSTGVKTAPMKIFHAPLLRGRWKRRRIVFLLQSFCGLRKTKEMLDMYRVRQCLALFL